MLWWGGAATSARKAPSESVLVLWLSVCPPPSKAAIPVGVDSTVVAAESTPLVASLESHFTAHRPIGTPLAVGMRTYSMVVA